MEKSLHISTRAKKASCGDQVRGKVLHTWRHTAKQNCITCNAEGGADHEGKKAGAVLVGQDRTDSVHDGSPDVGGDDEILGLDGGVVEAVFDNDGKKCAKAFPRLSLVSCFFHLHQGSK